MIPFGPIALDPIELGSQGSAILGIRDSGKSYTATLLAEGLFDAGVPFIAFDPIGVWRFLRVPGGAKGKGYPIVIAGGEAGDLPLSPASAPMIVEAAMQNGVSLVIDLFHMELSKADWRRIVRDCIRLLLHRNKQYGLRHIFLEEAAEFAPQQVRDGEVYAEIEKLARMGGNSRLGYTLINQRSQEVNKAVLELCDNLFLHRQKGLNALSNLKKWLDVSGASGAEVMRTLPTLPQGECWAWLSGSDTPVHVKVPPKSSLHPDRRVTHGTAAVTAKAAVDVGAFVAKLTETLPEIEETNKANDPKLLRAEVARLTRELAKAQRQVKEPPAPERVIANADEIAAARAEGERIGEARGIARAQEALKALRIDGPGQTVSVVPKQPRSAAPKAVAVPVAAAPTGGDPALSGPQRQVLGALAWWAHMGNDEPTRAQVCAILGWKITSGHIKNVAGTLKSAGLVDYPANGRLSMTDPGRNAAPDPDTSLSFHDQLRSTLSGPQRLVFDHLLAVGTDQTRAEVCEALGWEASSGHIKNVAGSLKTLEIVRYPASGVLALEPWAIAA